MRVPDMGSAAAAAAAEPYWARLGTARQSASISAARAGGVLSRHVQVPPFLQTTTWSASGTRIAVSGESSPNAGRHRSSHRRRFTRERRRCGWSGDIWAAMLSGQAGGTNGRSAPMVGDSTFCLHSAVVSHRNGNYAPRAASAAISCLARHPVEAAARPGLSQGPGRCSLLFPVMVSSGEGNGEHPIQPGVTRSSESA